MRERDESTTTVSGVLSSWSESRRGATRFRGLQETRRRSLEDPGGSANSPHVGRDGPVTPIFVIFYRTTALQLRTGMRLDVPVHPHVGSPVYGHIEPSAYGRTCTQVDGRVDARVRTWACRCVDVSAHR